MRPAVLGLFSLAYLWFLALLGLIDRHLQGRARSPLAALAIAGAIALGAVLAWGGPLTAPALGVVDRHVVPLLVVGGIVIVTGMLVGCSGRVRPATVLLALALSIVLACTWLPKTGLPATRPDGIERLRVCLVTDPRWGTPGWTGLLTDALPNVILYLPLGIAAWALLRRRGWVAVVLGAVLSFGSEVHQALFTDRVCKVNDIAMNTVGVVVGLLVFRALERWSRRGRAVDSTR